MHGPAANRAQGPEDVSLPTGVKGELPAANLAEEARLTRMSPTVPVESLGTAFWATWLHEHSLCLERGYSG